MVYKIIPFGNERFMLQHGACCCIFGWQKLRIVRFVFYPSQCAYGIYLQYKMFTEWSKCGSAMKSNRTTFDEHQTISIQWLMNVTIVISSCPVCWTSLQCLAIENNIQHFHYEPSITMFTGQRVRTVPIFQRFQIGSEYFHLTSQIKTVCIALWKRKQNHKFTWKNNNK